MVVQICVPKFVKHSVMENLLRNLMDLGFTVNTTMLWSDSRFALERISDSKEVSFDDLVILLDEHNISVEHIKFTGGII